jgi:SPP1 family predicted phage head-tail adaptor
MRAGKLDRRITIQRPAVSQSGSGAETATWQDVATVWAERVSGPGNERYVAQQFVGKSVLTFNIRWSDAVKEITSKHQVVFDGRACNVLDVKEIGRREGLMLYCEVRSESPVAG